MNDNKPNSEEESLSKSLNMNIIGGEVGLDEAVVGCFGEGR